MPNRTINRFDPKLQVALRGNLELRKEVLGTPGKRGRPGLKDALLDALNKVPAAAAAALTHMGERYYAFVFGPGCWDEGRAEQGAGGRGGSADVHG